MVQACLAAPEARYPEVTGDDLANDTVDPEDDPVADKLPAGAPMELDDLMTEVFAALDEVTRAWDANPAWSGGQGGGFVPSADALPVENGLPDLGRLSLRERGTLVLDAGECRGA